MTGHGNRRRWAAMTATGGAALLIVLALGWTHALIAAGKLDQVRKAGTIQAGWANFKPLIYTDTDTGKVTGFWGEITELMASEGLHVKTQWVEGSWATIVTGIQTGKWDVAPAGITDTRSEVALATRPFAKVDYTMLIKDKSTAKSWKDLDQPGKRISVSQGSNTDQALTKVIKQATIVRVRQEQALLELLGDKVDAQAVQKDYAMQAIPKYPGLRTVGDAFGSSFIGWYVPKGADDLRSAVEEWLDGAKKRGIVKQLLDKWKLEGAEPA
jgi:polar amino acid transport system substrate-binding protein